MCPLSVVFFSAFLAGVLAGGAVAVSAAMLVLSLPAASVAVIWGGGVMGSLAVFAAALAWRLTSTACRSAERQE
jgi:threonine dehydrogenase-like Zn-dependent dehydrogenase